MTKCEPNRQRSRLINVGVNAIRLTSIIWIAAELPPSVNRHQRGGRLEFAIGLSRGDDLEFEHRVERRVQVHLGPIGDTTFLGEDDDLLLLGEIME